MMCPISTKKPGRPRDEGLQARRQEEILDAAAKVFAERGYADTDVQIVADGLGVGKGTVYRYFASKRELFLAAVDRGMQRLHEHVLADTSTISDELERIVRAIYSFLAYFDEHPELVELFLQERAQFKDRKTPSYFAFHEANVGPWRALYERLVAEGRVRSMAEDLDVVNDLLFGTILANYFTRRTASHEAQAEAIVDIVFRGILTDEERRRRGLR
jgi:AcrR family transcriptional regulator